MKRATESGLLLLLLFLMPSAPSLAQGKGKSRSALLGFPVVTLQGTVRMDGGERRNNHALVQVKTTEGEVVEEDSVSSNGEFMFQDLRKRSYFLLVSADGYGTSVQTLDLTNVGSSYFINVTLTILDPSEVSTVAPVSRTDATAPKKARKEFEEGVRSLNQKKLDEAHAHFQKAVEIYPCYARAQTDLALTMMREHKAPDSEAPLKKAIECDPDYAEAYFQLGRLLNAQSRFSESHGVLAEGVRRAPSTWRLYFQLAQADEGLKNYPLAEQEYLQTQSFGPTAPAVHEKFANLYLKEKAYEKAYAEMQAYLSADPNGRYAAKVKEVMAQLESAGLVHPLQSKSGASAPLNP
ncbi:MAG TPA: tetratricopeptide repeat protein [Terriglobia bacterium]|nr:tetratricopeptide repeat protein [Terriglobia bacterium]